MIQEPLAAAPAPPLAGAETWLVVMLRARHRCQCVRCPKHRKSHDGRCEVESRPGVRLIASPAYPAVRPEPVTTDPGKLMAYCPDCYDQAVSRSRKLERDRIATQGTGMDALF